MVTHEVMIIVIISGFLRLIFLFCVHCCCIDGGLGGLLNVVNPLLISMVWLKFTFCLFHVFLIIY